MSLRFSTLALASALVLTPFLADGVSSPWERKPTKPDASQGAMVSQTIGTDTWVRIAYHRPGVKGRSVWTDMSANGRGLLVPRDGEPGPWRAGANESTLIEFTGDVAVEGQPLAAGSYELYMIPTDNDWTVIFQPAAGNWGAGRYDAEQDVLRVEVTPVAAPHQEWLSYGFDEPLAQSATAYLAWEQLKVPFKIEVAAAPEAK